MKNFDISTGAVVLLSVLYFFCGIKTLSALLCAVAVHELGHLTAMKCFGAVPVKFEFEIGGMCINCRGFDNRRQEFTALLAGPSFGLVLAYIASYLGNTIGSEFFLTVSGFSFILSVYNLLPILPLDGGRMLKCALAAMSGEKTAAVICNVASLTFAVLLALSGVCNLHEEWGKALTAAAIVLILSQMKERELL